MVRGAGLGAALGLVVPGLAVWPVVCRSVVAVLVEVGRSLAVAVLVVRRSLAVVGRRSPVPVVAVLVVDRSLVSAGSGRSLVLGPVAALCLVRRQIQGRFGALVPGNVVMPVWCRIRVPVVMPRLSRGRHGVLVLGNVLTPQ
ncbi:hypothetical protein [Amycolatopsis sulphurea]|uniref:hypothetical protein n=1 Tax=Amycolatopsis sulphurea TaxID=76022 RepID=UPI001475509B|nr:hypothetical protein [Amycolatopsis sulphurea]